MFYVATYQEGYETVNCVNPLDYKKIRTHLLRQNIEEIRGMDFEIRKSDSGETEFFSKTPWLGPHVLLLREAVDKDFLSILSDEGHLVDCTLNGEEKISMFCARNVDALDLQRSKVKYFKGTDKIMKIEKYVFDFEMTKNHRIFGLPLKSSPIFFSEDITKTFSLESIKFAKVV